MEVGLYTTTPEVESSKTDGDKKKDKDKTDKKEENKTSEEDQDTTTQLNSILRESLILKIRVFKDRKIQLLVKKQLFVLPLLKANIE